MNVISRGVRNTFRNSVRTVSIVLILGLSIGLALSMLVAHNAVEQKITSVKNSIGNIITISPAGARGFEGGGEPLTNDEVTKVKASPHVVAVTETLQDRLTSSDTNLQSAIDPGTLGQRFNRRGGGDQFGGDMPTPNIPLSLPVPVIGTNNPSSLQSFGGGTTKLTSGKSFDPNVDATVAIIGSELATKNSLAVGSTFQAYGNTVTVVGIFDAGNRFSNSSLVMPLATVQRLSGQTTDISSAIVQVDSIDNLNATVTSLKQMLGTSADVVSQQDTSTEALAPLQNITSVSLISLLGALVAGAVIILLTMIMIVRERRREIGVLKAIGASNLKVIGQFMAEAITFTLLGAILGLGLGVLGANPVTKLLVNNSSGTQPGPQLGGGMRGGGQFFRVLRGGATNLQNIHASAGLSLLAYGLLAAVIIAAVGSTMAAFLIAKVRPAEVMRAE